MFKLINAYVQKIKLIDSTIKQYKLNFVEVDIKCQ